MKTSSWFLSIVLAGGVTILYVLAAVVPCAEIHDHWPTPWGAVLCWGLWGLAIAPTTCAVLGWERAIFFIRFEVLAVALVAWVHGAPYGFTAFVAVLALAHAALDAAARRAWARAWDPEALEARMTAIRATKTPAERAFLPEGLAGLRALLAQATPGWQTAEFHVLAHETLADVAASAACLKALAAEDWAAVQKCQSVDFAHDTLRAVALRVERPAVPPAWLWVALRSPVELFDREELITWQAAQTEPPGPWEKLF